MHYQQIIQKKAYKKSQAQDLDKAQDMGTKRKAE